MLLLLLPGDDDDDDDDDAARTNCCNSLTANDACHCNMSPQHSTTDSKH